MEGKELNKGHELNNDKSEGLASEMEEISSQEKPLITEDSYIEEDTAIKEKSLLEEIESLRDKYLRLYAEFENYKKRMAKDKEEFIRFANESLIYELLPSIDNLEIALKHSENEVSHGIKEGVEITLRELLRTLERFGLTPIEGIGKPFNPEFHEAMMQVERDDMEENMIAEELRKGYIYKDKVLRPSLVAVSKKPQRDIDTQKEEEL